MHILRYLSRYRDVLWKNCWLQVLCVYGSYPSLHIRQQEITRTWKQTRQTAETSQFGKNKPKYSIFFFEIFYCIEPMNIREKIQCCQVAPCSNDRVVFASMLHVFIASVNKRKQHFWVAGDFILSPSSTASSWQSSLHHKEIWNVLQG